MQAGTQHVCMVMGGTSLLYTRGGRGCKLQVWGGR